MYFHRLSSWKICPSRNSTAVIEGLSTTCRAVNYGIPQHGENPGRLDTPDHRSLSRELDLPPSLRTTPTGVYFSGASRKQGFYGNTTSHRQAFRAFRRASQTYLPSASVWLCRNEIQCIRLKSAHWKGLRGEFALYRGTRHFLVNESVLNKRLELPSETAERTNSERNRGRSERPLEAPIRYGTSSRKERHCSLLTPRSLLRRSECPRRQNFLCFNQVLLKSRVSSSGE